MQIDIQTRGFTMTDALLGYAKRRLHFALAYCSDRINRVVIRLSDINGPRGGADKRCQVKVVMPGMPEVVVEDTEVNLYDAIDRAIDRTSRTVERKMDRQLTRLRQHKRLAFEDV